MKLSLAEGFIQDRSPRVSYLSTWDLIHSHRLRSEATSQPSQVKSYDLCKLLCMCIRVTYT